MSLIKKPTMTEENRAAHQRNGRQSRGAATPDGKERSRAAHLRHGCYSAGREKALRALGEDPADLADLRQATFEEWQPASAFQANLVERLARLWWRLERAERIQESLVARQMRQIEKRRQDAALQMRLKGSPSIALLELLEEFPVDPRFYTPVAYFRMFNHAYGGKVKGTEKEILMLLHRLRKPKGGAVEFGKAAAPPPDPKEGPGSARPGRTPSAPTEEPAEDVYLSDLEEMDEDDFLIPWPMVAAAEGAEPDELRWELRAMARHGLEVVHGALDPLLEERERPLSRIDQDEAQARPHPHAELMRREEESCFRQFMRLGNFLLKIQNWTEKRARAEKRAGNEGSPGYVDENTERGETDEMTNCPELVPDDAEESRQMVARAGAGVHGPKSEGGSAATQVRSPASEARSERLMPKISNLKIANLRSKTECRNSKIA